MQTIVFLVQGSAAEPYRVTFQRNENKISAYCSCPAGINGQYCKHRISILKGKSEGIVSDNMSDASVVSSWLPGSNVAKAMSSLEDAEYDLELAKQSASDAKKALAASMRNV